jgi:hypothetical protein
VIETLTTGWMVPSWTCSPPVRTKFDIYVLITSAISEYQHLVVIKQQTILVLLLLNNIYDCIYVTNIINVPLENKRLSNKIGYHMVNCFVREVQLLRSTE